MSDEMIPYPHPQSLPFEMAASIADAIAMHRQLEKYQRSVTQQTLRRQQTDIALFREYCHAAGIPTDDLFTDIEAWRGVSWGIVEGFREWQLQQGYAIGSINVRLATIKAYAKVALKAGILDAGAMQLIQTVKGIRVHEARNIDARREQIRRGPKKAQPTRISPSHMDALIALLEKDASYIGRRDFLLVCLLGRQGLRCGEVAGLQLADVHLAEGLLTFYRPKVYKVQNHRLHQMTLQTLRRYLAVCRPEGVLFEGVDHAAWVDQQGKQHKAHMATQGLSARAINERIRYLGEQVGLDHLSPHDLRHYWVDDAFKYNTPIDIVMEAGGWNSYEMPLRYKGDSAIANEGIKQS